MSTEEISAEEISAEQLAKAFFHYHEALGPAVSSATGSRPQSWNDVSWSDRSRMIAAARLALIEIGHSKEAIETDSSRYFATPGAAEWGC